MAGCDEDKLVQFEAAVDGAISGIKDKRPKQLQGSPMKRYHDVWCGRMDKSFQLFGVKKIDLFSIDVEGTEVPLLESIDFNKVQINVIVIEVGHLSPKDKKRMTEILTDKGNMKKVPLNNNDDELWVRNGF